MKKIIISTLILVSFAECAAQPAQQKQLTIRRFHAG
jgi:hypothetical protein